MLRWVLQEIQELQAMRDCLATVSQIQAKITQLKEQLLEDRELLAAQTAKKFNFRGLWRKVTGREQTDQELEDSCHLTERLIDQWTQVRTYVEVMVWVVCVPRFCRDRGEQFHGFVDQLCSRHIAVAEAGEHKWQGVLAKLQETSDTSQQTQAQTALIA